MDHSEKYFTSALRFLQYRSRSEKEVRDNLKKKKASDEMITLVIEKLKKLQFLDDTAFAKGWVESRMRSRPRSAFLLQRELRQKGIAEEIIENVLQTKESGVDTDASSAIELARRKIRRYKDLPREQIYIKLGALLARNGFNWSDIKQAIDEVLKEGYNTSERQ